MIHYVCWRICGKMVSRRTNYFKGYVHPNPYSALVGCKCVGNLQAKHVCSDNDLDSETDLPGTYIHELADAFHAGRLMEVTGCDGFPDVYHQ